MSSDRDTTRVVRSWLEEGVTSLPDRVLDDVLDRLPTTPQRRSWWPARRFAEMNNFAKLALAAAAVAVIAVVGLNLLPASGGLGGDPTASPTPSTTQTPIPSPTLAALPNAGEIAIGRYALRQGGIPFTLEVPTSGWVGQGGGSMNKGSFLSPAGATLGTIASGMDGVYSDPCAQVPDTTIGPSAADLAAAVAAIPGLDTTGPTEVTVGGLPAKMIVITVPDDIGCAPDDFFLWYDDGACAGHDPCPRWASQLGQTLRVWVVDVDGERVWVEAETYAGATPEIEQEIQRIIDSIQFE
jgi:hypothetical protein